MPADEFRTAILSLFQNLARAKVTAWLDSGCLLSLTRDRGINPWEKDIDVGAWGKDVARLREALTPFAHQHDCVVAEKHLNQRPYAITLRQRARTRLGAKVPPIAIHLFDEDAGFAISPQPHFLFSHGAPIPRFVVGQATSRRTAPDLRARWASYCEDHRRDPVMSLARMSASLRLERFIAGLVRLQASCQKPTDPRHPVERPASHHLYAVFTWRIPAHHFAKLEQLGEGDDAHVRIPSDTRSYLELRYGSDWTTPRQRWSYVLDDGALYP
jgi:hypothetical protein